MLRPASALGATFFVAIGCKSDMDHQRHEPIETSGSAAPSAPSRLVFRAKTCVERPVGPVCGAKWFIGHHEMVRFGMRKVCPRDGNGMFCGGH